MHRFNNSATAADLQRTHIPNFSEVEHYARGRAIAI